MATFFGNGLQQLADLGVFEVFLPFVLIFTVVYAIMLKTKILGEKKQFNVMIALVLALSVVIPHSLGTYPPNADPVNLINDVLPHVSMIMVGILAVLLMIGMWGKNVDIAGSSVGGWIVMISAAVVIYLFLAAADMVRLPNFLSWLNDSDVMSILIILLVFGIIISFITKDEDQKSGESFAENFKKLLK